MASVHRYDTIGVDYRNHRRPDPRIAARIWSAVGDASRIVNVGAGTGSYEDASRSIIAVEPSPVMVSQRPPDGAPVVRAAAERLPFAAGSFDVALALMTVHHWKDVRVGLSELRRVAPRQVVFTFDEDTHSALWVFDEYVPAAHDVPDRAPVDMVAEVLEADRVEVILTPADCTDGFGSAYWRRPELYLSPAVRANISVFARLDQRLVEAGMARLAEDLDSGAWYERHADLMTMDEIDSGLRLVVAG